MATRGSWLAKPGLLRGLLAQARLALRLIREPAVPLLAKAVPVDPWGNPYQYRQPGEHGEYDLWSFGNDGQPGGTGEAADVTNW